MTWTGSSTPENKGPADAKGAPPLRQNRKAGSRRSAHRLIGTVGWSVLFLLGGLLIFYGWRIGSNQEALTQRNLRELDRIGHAVEGRLEGFAAGLQGWHAVQRNNEETGPASFQRLVPNLIDSPVECVQEQPRAVVSQRRVRLCYALVDTLASAEAKWWSGTFDLEPLTEALRTDVFDATFLMDDLAGVFITNSGPARSDARRGLAGLRLQEIPPDTTGGVGGRVSTVRNVTIAGREYRLFLQPLDIQSPPGEPADSSGVVRPPVQWWAGGLVSTSRFRAESLAMDPPHLIFLGLLLVLAVLALPFLRAALMGPVESIKPVDVYLLSLSLALATGILGIAAADIRHFGPYSRSLNQNLVKASDRVASALQLEVRLALDEMDRWWWEQPAGLNNDSLIFKPFGTIQEGRYLHFQMIIWIDSTGEQQAKLTPRARNTPLIPVPDRDYFRRIMDERSYVVPGGSRRYYIESIRSKNTGEKIATISKPSWAPDTEGNWVRGVTAMTTRLVSLDMPVLPPGVSFAVVRGDGLTLFHSDPGRNLEENFLGETSDNGRLHALFAAWDSGTVRGSHMGRRSRMHVRPLEGTDVDSLSLVLILDEGLPGTAHFEGIFMSLSAFMAWVLILLAAFLLVELLLPRRLRWAWPDHDRPWKYPVLTGLLLAFAALLVAQSVIASRLRLSVDAATFLIPVQALSVALLVQSFGWSGQARAWRNPRTIGWTVLLVATLLQLGLLQRSGSTEPVAYLLQWAPIGMAVLAGAVVSSLGRLKGRAGSRVALEPWYMAAIVATLATTALMPAYLLHQEVMTQQKNRLIQYEQVKLLEGMRQREHRIRQEARRVGLAGFDTTMLNSLDLAVPPVLGAVAADPATNCREVRSDLRAHVFKHIEHLMPFVTAAAVEMRHLDSGSGGMSLQTCAGDVLHLASTSPPVSTLPQGADRFRLSAVPGSGAVTGARLLLLLGILFVGGAIAAALARWLGRRVFLLDLPEYQQLDLAKQLAAAPDAGHTSIVAVCKRSMDRTPLIGKNSLNYRDLLEFGWKDHDLENALEAARKEDQLLVLDHFDHRLDDRTWSERLLASLETHVSVHGRRVVLMTSREPCALFPLLAYGGGREQTTDRWVRLLGQFADIAVADLSDDRSATGASRAVVDAPAVAIGQSDRADDHEWIVAGDHSEPSTGGTRAQHDAATVASGGSAGKPAPEVTRAGTAWHRGDIARLLQHARHISARWLPGAASVDTAAERTLQQEGCGRRRLEEVAAYVRRRPDFHSLTPDGVVEQFRDMADSYYHALWNILDPDEKLVVTQLAYGVVVNPSSKRAVRRLLARRVLVRDPGMRLMTRASGVSSGRRCPHP